MAAQIPTLDEIEALLRRVVREELRAAAPEVMTVEQAAAPDRPRHQVVRYGRGKDRYEGLRLAVGKCSSCGWKPPPTGRGCGLLNVHHVIPAAAGGGEDSANLLVLCPNCHAVAHALTFVGWNGEKHLGPGSADRLLDLLKRLRDDPERFCADEVEFLRELRFARTGDCI